MADGKSVGERREERLYHGDPRKSREAQRYKTLHILVDSPEEIMERAVRETPQVLREAAAEKGLEEGRKPPSRLRRGLERAKR